MPVAATCWRHPWRREMDKRAVVYSDTLGLVPCQVVGRNDSRYLVRLMGATVHVPKELVFELDDGWELSGGQVVLADRSPDPEEGEQ